MVHVVLITSLFSVSLMMSDGRAFWFACVRCLTTSNGTLTIQDI